MRRRPKGRCDQRCGLQFGAVALAVIERQAVAGKTPPARQGKYGGGVESAGEKDDCR